jgi:hypothetical protein
MGTLKLEEALADWTDFDTAEFVLAKNIGLMDEGTAFAFQAKPVFRSKHPVGEALANMLFELVDCGVLEHRGDRPPDGCQQWRPRGQFRWNQEFEGSWVLQGAAAEPREPKEGFVTFEQLMDRMRYYGHRSKQSRVEELELLFGSQDYWSALDILEHEDLPEDERLSMLFHSDLLDDSQMRLFSCACAKRILQQELEFGRQPDATLYKTIAVARRYAEGDEEQDLGAARKQSWDVEKRLNEVFRKKNKLYEETKKSNDKDAAEDAARACSAAGAIPHTCYHIAHFAASGLCWASYGSLVPNYKQWQLDKLREMVAAP